MDAGHIKGEVELGYGGVASGMAAAVQVARTGTATLKSLFSRPFEMALDAGGLRKQLTANIGQASSFTKTLAETAKSSTALASALVQTERAVRSLNEQSDEFERTLRRVGSESDRAVQSLGPLPAAATATRNAVSGLRSDTSSLATAMQRVSDRSETLSSTTTSLSGRLGTLGRNIGTISPAADSAITGLRTLEATTLTYAAAALGAANAARANAAALNQVASAAGRAASAKRAAAAATTAYATAAGTASAINTVLVRSNNAATASANSLALATRRATMDIVLMRTAAAGGDAEQLVSGMSRSVERLLPLMDNGWPKVQTFWGMVRSTGQAASEAAPAVEGLSSGLAALPAPSAAAASGVGAIATGIGALAAAALVVVPPLIGLGATLAALHSGPVQLAADMEQTTVAFNVLTGSADKAKSMLNDLKLFADTTPFQFPEVAKAAKQLLAMGVESQHVVSTLRMLGDVSSGLSQPLGDIAYLYGQVVSRGAANSMELREFAMRGVPIYSELAKVMGVSVEQLHKLTVAGEVTSSVVQAAFKSMTSEGGRFNNLTALQSQTLSGLESTAEDAYNAMKRDIGEAMIKNLELKDTVHEFIELMTAARPAIVDTFTVGLSALKPFIESLHSVIGLTREIAKSLEDVESQLQSTFGPELTKALSSAVTHLNPLTQSIWVIHEVLDKLAYAIKTIREGAEALKYLGVHASEAGRYLTGDSTQTAVTKEELAVDMSAQRQHRAAQARESAKAEAGKSVPSTPTIGGGVATEGAEAVGGVAADAGGHSSRSTKAAETEAARSAEHTRELQGQTAVAQLKAAGKEYEASLVEINNKMQGDLEKAGSIGERQAIVADANAKMEEARSKKAEEVLKGMRESGQRAMKAVAEANIAALKAAGKELEARYAEIELRYKDQIAKAGTPGELASLQEQSRLEKFQAKTEVEKEQAEKAKSAADKAAREKEQRDRTLAETAARTQEYQTRAYASALESLGRHGEAELTRFDAEWQKRIADIKDAGEKAAAQAAYLAERATKIADLQKQGGFKQSTGAASLPTSLADAQRRVRDARAGSGERELARLDLRQVLGKLTGDESARRDRLGLRFGRVDGTVAGSPLGAVAPSLNPTNVRNAGPNAASAQYVANPTVNIDGTKLAAACVKAMEPVINAKLKAFENRMTDRQHAQAGKEDL